MKPLLRALALGVGPVVVAAGLEILETQSTPTKQLTLKLMSTACSQPPVFKTVYQSYGDSVRIRGNSIDFTSDSWIETVVCSPGTLLITAEGEVANDEAPILTVALDMNVILSAEFNKKNTLRIPISQPGVISLAYLNDYYLADIRTVNFRNLSLTASSCKDFKNIVRSMGTTWSEGTHTASLNKAGPLIVSPCSNGILTGQVLGRKGSGKFPKLQFKQNDRVIKDLETDLTWKKFSFLVDSSPLEIVMLNPYGKLLADRNLVINDFQYIPNN